MNVEIWNDAAQFHFWEYINRIFGTVHIKDPCKKILNSVSCQSSHHRSLTYDGAAFLISLEHYKSFAIPKKMNAFAALLRDGDKMNFLRMALTRNESYTPHCSHRTAYFITCDLVSFSRFESKFTRRHNTGSAMRWCATKPYLNTQHGALRSKEPVV
jgi:hypothetical protein